MPMVTRLSYRKPARIAEAPPVTGPEPISTIGGGRGGILISFTEGQQK
jgi:hypothetical protein